jgi:hypothetical protein
MALYSVRLSVHCRCAETFACSLSGLSRCVSHRAPGNVSPPRDPPSDTPLGLDRTSTQRDHWKWAPNSTDPTALLPRSWLTGARHDAERNGLALSNAGFPAGFRRRRRLFDPPSPGSPWSWNSLKPYRAFGWAFSQDGLHHLYGFPARLGPVLSLWFSGTPSAVACVRFSGPPRAQLGIPRRGNSQVVTIALLRNF